MNNESLRKLFSELTDNNPVCAEEVQDNLFELTCEKSKLISQYEEDDIQLILKYYSGYLTPSSIEEPLLEEPARLFHELSADAFDIFIHAWMSELPIKKEIIKFGRSVIAAWKAAGNSEEKRKAVLIAALNRSDPDTLTVLNAAAKVQYEIHRMQGLLRFSPDKDGVYLARCAPDHLIIPALAGYLTARFGETAWAVIDENRLLYLSRKAPEQVKITLLETCSKSMQQSDGWEELWKNYHKTINNESRKNAGLQRQFMPKRYWKYLPEM
jgi:probable DNA metabolism protein